MFFFIKTSLSEYNIILLNVDFYIKFIEGVFPVKFVESTLDVIQSEDVAVASDLEEDDQDIEQLLKDSDETSN